MQSVLFALLWVLLGLGSLASAVVALWVVLSLARAAAVGGGNAFLPWFIAVALTLGLPFALAVWKHQHAPKKISLTMAWLPMVWNTLGLLAVSQLVPDIVGEALRGQGSAVAAETLGESHSATRVMSALGHHTADAVDPEPPPTVPDRAAPPLPSADADLDLAKAISVPLEEQGTAIFVDVGLEGYGGRHAKKTYLFDTGASYTTLSTQAAAELGIVIPEDAPVLEFDTAKGRRESRMVYLPALRLGQVRIEGLVVSVCDKCINGRHTGLLGQNVMRRFLARIDFQGGRMLLIPRTGETRPNRAYDIGPMVQMEVEGDPVMWGDRVHWVIEVHNRSTVPIRDVIPTANFTGGPNLQGAKIDEIGPGEVGRSLVKGKVGSAAQRKTEGHFKLGLSEAYW